ncbi:MAG TPA: DUF4175 family protein [Vicinamibacterales bacterium]
MTQHADGRSELMAVIHDVRRRWRLKLALRGAAIAAGCAATALVLSAWGLQWMRFTPESILAFRIAMAVVVGVLGYVFLARPLVRRVTDEQVAMYLEEHEPSLEAAIISAVEAEGGLPAQSPALVRKLVETAAEKCRAIEDGRRVERSPVRRYSGALGGVVALAAAIFLLGPAYMRHALSALLVISRSVEAAAPYRIDVTPGHRTIPRGADQPITAKLVGFQADQAVLMIRKNPTAAFERVALIRSEDKYEGTLFDVAAPVEYFVEAVGVRSPLYTLKVADMPYVQKLELEYHFPAYTGLQPRKIEDGGDIAVLTGTEIRVRAVPTMAAAAGAIVVDDKAQVPMAVQSDGALKGAFVADHDGFYRIDMEVAGGPMVGASPKYSIDVLADQPPTVSFTKPGRDTSASPIEEVFLEAKADDDYGVKTLDLQYSINGGPEKTVKLFDGTSRMTTVSAGHTLYLEEMGVKPGDSVSYYARVGDNDTVAGSQKALSDLYFIRVRPLTKDFKKAESQGQGQGQQNQVGALSEQERQIIAATFNIQRDRKTSNPQKVRESTVVVGLMQKRLREQVNELLTNFAGRVGSQAERFKKITDFLKQSVPEMQTAEGKLQAATPDTALPPEHRALELLQKAEEEYELQVSVSQQQGGGGGGGQQKMAEELANLFELEVDKMANQYETTQRASQQQADQKIDELAEKLKELARRQEQEAEAARRRAAAGQGQGGGDAQRALADQAEEAARQLEKLAREENRPQLQQTARRLQQAADAMRQAAAKGDPNAAAAAAGAMEQLKEAEKQLSQSQSARTGRDVEDALRQAEAMSREQQQIQDDVNKLDAPGVPRADKAQHLSDRKNQLAGKVDQLEKQLDRTAGDMFKNERDASRKLTEAANAIRDKRIRDKIRYSDSMLRGGSQTSDVASFDRDIQNNLDDLKKKIGEAAAAVGNTKPDANAQALDKARQLAQGLQSLGERMRSSGQQDGQQQGQRGQQSQQPGQQGQSQDGKQGQQGQQGQQGKQGQGQGQQGAQGQQGQNGQQAKGGGQGGNGGRNPGDPTQGGRNGQGDTRGAMPQGSPSSLGDARPMGRFTGEQVRQFRGEARQRAADAEQLKKLLQGQKIDAKELDPILKGLRKLDDEGAYANPENVASLEQAVTDDIKRFEYTLRRRLDANASQVFLSGTDDVPEQYRKLVEQYYRSLSKGGGKE